MGKIYVLGTSHIAKQSVKRVRELYDKKQPGIVAVELDRQRLVALLHNQKSGSDIRNIFRIGLHGYLLVLIGGFIQKKLGRLVGLKPGADMLEASKLAIKNNKKLLLIDRDIQITLKRFSKRFSWKERVHLMSDIITGLFLRKTVAIDLNRVPEEELIEKILESVKERYPNVYGVLIEERNKHMAAQLLKAHQMFPKEDILAVVGAGHKKGLLALLKEKTRS
jgi:pheromone shutdown-related protein TraB